MSDRWRHPSNRWLGRRDKLEPEDLRKRISIGDVLRHYGGEVPSTGEGWRKMRCPFHPDRRPSASVHFGKGAFRCHGCDVAGDIFSIVQKREGIHDFMEACQWLARTFL